MNSATGATPIEVNGVAGQVPAGTSVAVAVVLLGGGHPVLRRSITGMPRGALCGMGTCHECRVTINGVPQRRSCIVECQPGMRIHTDER